MPTITDPLARLHAAVIATPHTRTDYCIDACADADPIRSNSAANRAPNPRAHACPDCHCDPSTNTDPAA